MKARHFFAIGSLLSLTVTSLPSSRSLFPRGLALAKRDNGTSDQMYQLSTDEDFHFELLGVLALAPYSGSDIGETLIAINKIEPGDFESFYSAFNSLANQVYGSAKAIDAVKYPISSRDAMFRAASYFRSADFYLHGNWSDPRINTLWDQALNAFDSATALLPVPAQRMNLTASNFTVPAIFYSCGQAGKRPVLIVGSGYDASQEESYHQIVQAALQRGIHAITYEGPGQPTVRRQQNRGFVPNWEAVVTPVVDYLLTRPDIDSSAIGLLGFSFGGYLAPRAAAFEHRLAAVLAIDGLYDFGGVLYSQLPPALVDAVKAGNADLVNNAINYELSHTNDTQTRWALQQGMWAFNTPTPYEWLVKLPAYTLEGVVGNITAPVFVGEAENDMFFKGQGRVLADRLGDLATYHLFTNAEGAGEHCSLGAQVLQNQVALDWFQGVTANKTGCASQKQE